MKLLISGNDSHGGYKVAVVASVLIVMQILMTCGRAKSCKLLKVSIAADDYVLLTATVRPMLPSWSISRPADL